MIKAIKNLKSLSAKEIEKKLRENRDWFFFLVGFLVGFMVTGSIACMVFQDCIK